VHRKRANPREIFNPRQKDGESLQGFHDGYIERSRNTEADELAKVAAHNMPLPADVFFQVMEDALVKTIKSEPRLINVIEGEDWRAPIMA
jgi:hypothetical protein